MSVFCGVNVFVFFGVNVLVINVLEYGSIKFVISREITMIYKTNICRICLKLIHSSDTFEALNSDRLRIIMLKELALHLNLSNASGYVICSKCSDSTRRLFNFKNTCVVNDIYVKMLVDDPSNSALVLEKIIGKGFQNQDGIKCQEDNVCRFCLKYFDIGSFTKISGLEENEFLTVMIEKCLPEADLNITKNPLICRNCLDLLQNLFNFTIECLNTDNRIKGYTSAVDTTDKIVQIDLMDVLKFESNPIDLKPIKLNIDVNNIDENNSEFVVKKEEAPEELVTSEFLVQMEESGVQEETLSPMDVEMEEELNQVLDLSMSKEASKQLLAPEVASVENNADELHDWPYYPHQTIQQNNALQHLLSYMKQDKQEDVPTVDLTSTEIHPSKKKPTKLFVYRCRWCLYKSSNKRLMMKHLKIHIIRELSLILQCNECSLKTMQKLYVYARELLSCEWCPFQTRNGTLFIWHLEDLEYTMRLCDEMEDDVSSLRPKTAVTDQDYQYRLTSGHKAVKMLQNRLEHSVKKFCSILTENKKLREDIDHLLKEMNHFNLIWEKLLKDMNSGKKYMVDLIEQATLAYDQREEWCSKLEALKKRAQNDFIAHTEEMREIQRQLDHDLTLREFLSVKGQRRILRDLEEKERKKKESQIENLENQLRLYEQTLEQIQKFCEEDDIERIASQFLKQEEENFALFNYVNELNHEIEVLHSNLTELEEKIDEQVQLSQARAKERHTTLRSLEYDLDEAVRKADEEKKGVKQSEKILQDVLNGIEGIFKLLNCDRGPILELLGENSSINYFNVSIYLGTIEKRISKIITMVYFAEKAMLTQARKFSKEDLVKLIQ